MWTWFLQINKRLEERRQQKRLGNAVRVVFDTITDGVFTLEEQTMIARETTRRFEQYLENKLEINTNEFININEQLKKIRNE